MPSTTQSSQHRRGKKSQAGQPRARPINSCLTCRDRKKGCDRRQPVCSNCIQNPDPNKPCVYYALGKAEVLKSHKRRMQSLKEDFASNIAKAAAYDEVEVHDSTARTSPAAIGTTHVENTDDEFADVSLRLGKLRITRRLGGAFCPIAVEELTNALEASSPFYPETPFLSPQFPSSIDSTVPIPPLIAPSIHHHRDSIELHKDTGFLPDRNTAKILLVQYWDSVHQVAKVLHRPSFTRQWMVFWESYELGKKVDKVFLALVLTVLFAASVSMPDNVAGSQLKHRKSDLIRQMRVGADIALARSNWIHSTQIEALQAIVIYLITVCRDEVSCAHSSTVAAAIRAAEGLGLHEDGTAGDYTAIQTHTRRLVWYQLLVLDIRTCEVIGPSPQKRKGDFSTQMPLNTDEDLIQNDTTASHEWTEMTATIIRFRCNEFIRDIWGDCLRLKHDQVSIGDVLIKIRTFDAQTRRAFGNMGISETPIQKYSCLVARILISGAYTMVLRHYIVHPGVQMSENLQKIFIKYGVETMDAVQELETAPEMQRWRWLFGTVQQYQTALAMLLEVLKNPYLSQATQMTKAIDYVFEPPAELASMPLVRLRCIATQLRDHMDFYANRHQSKDTQGDLRDPPDLDFFDSSTCSSSATPGDVSPITQGSLSEEHQMGADILCSNFMSVRRGRISRSKQVPGISAFPNRSYQSHRNIGRQIVDIDAQLLARYFPDIIEMKLTTTAEKTHRFHESLSCFSNLQFPIQSTKSDIAEAYYDENLRNESCSPGGTTEHTNKPLEESEDPYPNFHNIDEFTGYCENTTFAVEPVNNMVTVPLSSDQHPEPFDSYSGVVNEQLLYNNYEQHGQQDHQHVPFSSSTPYLPNQQSLPFQNDIDLNAQSTSQLYTDPQDYQHQFSESLDYSAPAYNAMNGRHT